MWFLVIFDVIFGDCLVGTGEHPPYCNKITLLYGRVFGLKSWDWVRPSLLGTKSQLWPNFFSGSSSYCSLSLAVQNSSIGDLVLVIVIKKDKHIICEIAWNYWHFRQLRTLIHVNQSSLWIRQFWTSPPQILIVWWESTKMNVTDPTIAIPRENQFLSSILFSTSLSIYLHGF